ncbi:MAG: DUF6036 family nucleotidyltransferase [Eggerthellales bacterium]|nr:DUF6036 family nucleotidyltransferase [Eggerthellales bacterium]
MNKEDLIRILQRIDEEVWLVIGRRDPKPRVVIVGGAAFMLRDLTPRKITHDIDVYEVDEAIRAILGMYPEVNRAVAAYADQIPYNFEDRLVVIDVGAKAIEFTAPCVEDMVVMKLYAERPSDIQDIDGAVSAGEIDWDLLERLVYSDDEAAASALSTRRYEEMKSAFERMKERCGR